LRAPWKWERLIVDSAVIGGDPARWERRLRGLGAQFVQQLEEEQRDDPESARVSRLRRDLRNLEHLARFALPIVGTLASWPAAALWQDWLERFNDIAPRVLRRPARVQRVLAELRPMGAIGPIPLEEARDVLAERLRLLERYGLVERTPTRGYRLTAAGRELEGVLDAMGVWGARWLETAPADLDAHVVLWSMCRLMQKNGQLPERRVVLRFDVSDARQPHYWVVLESASAEVCVKPPGFDVDVVVATDSEWLALWHMGRLPMSAAIRRGLMRVKGPRTLVRELGTWGLSRFAGVAPAVQ
jgi:hypothetical protein